MPNKIIVTPRSLSGAGHPALSMLTERGYELTYPAPGKTPSKGDLLGANSRGVAELAIETEGRTMGVVGCGAIWRTVARRRLPPTKACGKQIKRKGDRSWILD